jgi:predicted transcriptional regulator
MGESLGELQLQVMQAVWRRGRATVAEVHEELAARRRLAYTTVLTTMRALERRGVLRHRQEGKAYAYEPTLSRDQYTSGSVGRLVRDLFQGSRERLLSHLLGTDKISRAEMARLRKLAEGLVRDDKQRGKP